MGLLPRSRSPSPPPSLDPDLSEPASCWCTYDLSELPLEVIFSLALLSAWNTVGEGWKPVELASSEGARRPLRDDVECAPPAVTLRSKETGVCPSPPFLNYLRIASGGYSFLNIFAKQHWHLRWNVVHIKGRVTEGAGDLRGGLRRHKWGAVGLCSAPSIPSLWSWTELSPLPPKFMCWRPNPLNYHSWR